MNIYIYTDSTGMPRPSITEMPLTWPQLLYNGLSAVSSKISFTVRYYPGTNAKQITKSFEKDAFYFHFQKIGQEHNLVIFAFGVSDAAPRPLTYPLRKLSNIPIFGPRLWSGLNQLLKPWKKLILKFGHYHLTSTANFERLMKKLISNSVGVQKFYLLDTPPPHKFLENRTPGFREDVVKYNKIKHRVAAKFENVAAVSLVEFSEDFYISKEDGHHFSSQGHEYVAAILLKFLTDDLKEFQNIA